jgi:hypothetical protein
MKNKIRLGDTVKLNLWWIDGNGVMGKVVQTIKVKDAGGKRTIAVFVDCENNTHTVATKYLIKVR